MAPWLYEKMVILFYF